MKKTLDPKEFKINYKPKTATAGSVGEWMLGILSKRLKVKPPELFRHQRARSGFRYPNAILLSSGLYNESLKIFIASCIHEFAHYMHLGGLNKTEYEKMSSHKHSQEFFDWLIVTARAAFGRNDGETLYPWQYEYKSIQNKAAKVGIHTLKKKKNVKTR